MTLCEFDFHFLVSICSYEPFQHVAEFININLYFTVFNYVSNIFTKSFNQHTNQCTYNFFYVNLFKIDPTCFDHKIIFRELHCSLFKSHF